MVNREQIEEWLREVEARPGSAALIIEYISRRLSDLSERNEALLSENIELRTGRKVDDYESRIANLEYQVDLLKRQLSGMGDMALSTPAVETVSVILYNAKGRVLRTEVGLTELESGKEAAVLTAPLPDGAPSPRILVTSGQEELAFLFDSGRTVTLAVSEIPAEGAGALDWSKAYLVEPRGNEELSVVAPVGRMALFDALAQVSRRGCVRKLMRASFETHLAKDYIGAGIKMKPDKPCAMALCAKDDLFVIASYEGFLLTMDGNGLPYTSEEALKLGVTDYIVSGFPLAHKPSLLVVTQNGKAIHREVGWLEKSESNKSRGQAIISPARREAGARIIGAAAVDADDWSAVLRCDGKVLTYKVGDLFESGAFGETSDPELVDFVTFTVNTNGRKS